MGRNCISRHVQSAPAVKGFRPFGRLGGKLKTMVLSLDEFEAIRLLDYENLNQEEAAVQMQVSRPTLTRIYEKARVKYATALVEGCILYIEGGEVHFEGRMFRCRFCRRQVLSVEAEKEQCPECGENVTEFNETDNNKRCRKGRRHCKGGNHART